MLYKFKTKVLFLNIIFLLILSIGCSPKSNRKLGDEEKPGEAPKGGSVFRITGTVN